MIYQILTLVKMTFKVTHSCLTSEQFVATVLWIKYHAVTGIQQFFNPRLEKSSRPSQKKNRKSSLIQSKSIVAVASNMISHSIAVC